MAQAHSGYYLKKLFCNSVVTASAPVAVATADIGKFIGPANTIIENGSCNLISTAYLAGVLLLVFDYAKCRNSYLLG